MSKLLVVDDDEFNLDMLVNRLEFRGFTVISAVSGPEALTTAESEQPDLILMDLGMPEMDGYEATRLLKQKPATASIPVIAFSAHTYEADRQKALDAGCDDYDSKPIEISRLMDKIETCLAGRGRE